LDGVRGDHVEFCCEGIEVPDYAFEFYGKVAMFLFHLLMALGVVLVRVAEGLELHCNVS
jgi:hypothetical protein